MVIRLLSGGLEGVDAFPVEVEVDYVRQGLPGFTLVGLAEAAVREAKDRVFAALRAGNFRLPPARVTVNLAPAGRRKAGASYDLPLAIGLLAAAGIIPTEKLDNCFFSGELSLSGELKPVSGVLPLAILARKKGADGLVVPPANAAEAAVVHDLKVYAPQNLAQCASFLAGETRLPPIAHVRPENLPPPDYGLDFGDVKGQQAAKRALEIAAAGGHNILMIGPPGSGKTMLAQRLPTILPPLDFEEALEVTKIYSVAGLLPPDTGLLTTRPFRSPHHTISNVALVGGGSTPRPGEVSLAHRGVLFLDELPEYGKSVLEVLRQPLEDGSVSIARVAQSVSYPAACMLVAAMNPCPCGYYGDAEHECVCRPDQRARYRARISGPLLDRIDVHVEVPAVPYEDLRDAAGSGASAQLRARVLAARLVQQKRYADKNIHCNAELYGALLERHCALSPQGHQLLKTAVQRLGLSARAYTRVLRLARTIADLAGVEAISAEHLAEGISLRVLDREG
ncbi:MAG: YifB family Mg chelatase-like AAA ATPase [Desulfovibrio sp.]|jgi:magnesium chelatase family protein|nr:YifB family Mg chelatase-like AAA ATPase [Desulfovibrio sp.]